MILRAVSNLLMSNLDKLKAMFPYASASTLKCNPRFGDKTNVQNYAPAQLPPVSVAHKKNKYGNVKVEHEGMKFDSKHELQCWLALKLREKSGEIWCLQRQVVFELVVNSRRVGRFTADFVWYDAEGKAVADAKSPITRKETAYRLRKRIFEAQFAPLVIREL